MKNHNKIGKISAKPQAVNNLMPQKQTYPEKGCDKVESLSTEDYIQQFMKDHHTLSIQFDVLVNKLNTVIEPIHHIPILESRFSCPQSSEEEKQSTSFLNHKLQEMIKVQQEAIYAISLLSQAINLK